MRFKIVLSPLQKPCFVPFNYQYPLSAVMYRILDQADEEYTIFLHQKGYTKAQSLKNFKFMTFSSIHFPSFEMHKKRRAFEILSEEISFRVSFYLDKLAESFIMGLFDDQNIVIANRDVTSHFQVSRIEAIPTTLPEEEYCTLNLKPISPVVIAKRMDKRDQYLPPTHEDFGPLLIRNLLDKYEAVRNSFDHELMEINEDDIQLRMTSKSEARSRLFAVKEGSPEETKIRGYYDFSFELTAPRKIMEIALSAGVGKHNAIGCGMLDIKKLD